MAASSHTTTASTEEDPAIAASRALDAVLALPAPDDAAIERKMDTVDLAMKAVTAAIPTSIAGIREALRWAQDDTFDKYESADIIDGIISSPLLQLN